MTANDYDWKICWTPLEIAAFADLKQAVLKQAVLNVEDQYAALKQHSNKSLLLYKRRL